MKTPPPNAQLRSYTEFDFDDNPPFKGELTTMFGQLAMCVSPHAGYGASDRILWAVVGEHMRFTNRENAHSYQYGLCLEVDPEAQTITMDWYARPFASWERGSNENFNGLLRQYVPKKRLMNTVDEDEITMIQNRLNNRPRKRLGFKTPSEVFHQSLKRVALRT